MTHCEPKARATLNVQQFAQVHSADLAKAAWSLRRLERARRRAATHLADCLPCFLSSLPSSPEPLSVPQ